MMKKIKKREVRKIVSERREKCSQEENAAMSEKIRTRLFETDEYQRAETLFIYVSFNNEVDTYEIMKGAWNDGKKVAVPCTGCEKSMEFIVISDFCELSRRVMGIPEPVYDPAEAVSPSEDDLIIMPGVAFDEEKNRAGYGGGYYDRWLERVGESVKKMALSFEFQVIRNAVIDTEDHDIRMDRIITEDRIF